MNNKTTQLEAAVGPKKIGPYEIHTIETGEFGLDGGAMFGIVPKPIWSKTNPSDEANRIAMRLRCLLLIERNQDQTPKRVVLIDNGIGSNWNQKFIEIYKIDHQRWALEQELKKHGIALDQVTDLIGTHLHFDHMGGTTYKDKDQMQATFSHAKLWLQETNWKHALNPNEKDRASYLKENYQIYDNDSKLQLVTSGPNERLEILPNIFVRVSNGHTTGMQLVEVADHHNSLIYCADAIPTATHIKTAYIMGYDCFPLTMIAEKKLLLKEAVDRNMILYFEHCPRAEAASILHDGKDFALKQAYRFS